MILYLSSLLLSKLISMDSVEFNVHGYKSILRVLILLDILIPVVYFIKVAAVYTVPVSLFSNQSTGTIPES